MELVNDMKWSINRKIVAAGIGVLLIAFVVSLTPWYRAYIDYDHQWTCAKYRKVLEEHYAELVQRSTYTIGSLELLEDAIGMGNKRVEYTIDAIPDAAVYAAYLLDGICLDGGGFTVTMDDAGGIAVRCNHPGHDADYDTYTGL